jgi:hypothetical protein
VRKRVRQELQIAFRFYMNRLIATALIACVSLAAHAQQFTIEQLQGAWWADLDAPTAAFAISGDEAWFDYDAAYHPCRIEGDVLVFDHGPDIGMARSRIIVLERDQLVLEDLAAPYVRRAYRRARVP